MNGKHETHRNGRHHAAPPAAAKPSRPMTPTMALVWRQWRESQGLFIVCLSYLVGLPVGMIPAQLSEYQYRGVELSNIIYGTIGGTTLFLAMIIAILPITGSAHRTASQEHAFLLPMRSGWTATYILLYRATSITVSVVIGNVLIEAVGRLGGGTGVALLADHMNAQSAASILIGVLAFYATMQALVWMAFPIHPFVGIVMGLVLLIVTNSIIGSLLDAPTLAQGLPALHWTAPVFPVGLAISAWGFASNRNGRWTDISRWRPDWRQKEHIEPFGSADEALRWYEWRRFVVWFRSVGAFLLVVFGGTSFVASLFTNEFTGYRDEYQHKSILEVIFYAALFISLLAGFIPFLRRWVQRERNSETFVYAMPVSTQRLSNAALRTAGRGTLSLGLVAFTLMIMEILRFIGSPSRATDPAVILDFYVVLTYFLCVVGVCIALWTAFLVGAPVMLFAYAYFGGALLYVIILSVRVDEAVWNAAMALFLAVLFPLIVCATAIIGYLRSHLSKSGIAVMVAALPLAVAVSAFYVYGLNADENAIRAEMSVFLSLAMVYPFAFWPTYLGWMRTR